MVVEHSKHDNTIENEVNKLFNKTNGRINSTDFINLKSKFNNEDLVEQIKKSYLEKYRSVVKYAKKFVKYVKEKYSNENYPYHIMIEKALHIKRKKNMTEGEFIEFTRIYENELLGRKKLEIYKPDTNFKKLFGPEYLRIDDYQTPSKLKESDWKYIQEIFKLYENKSLHAAVYAQSLEYEDCSNQALNGQYFKQQGYRTYQSIHPVVAALFIPKINILDTHFLRANLANIVNSRFNNIPMTIADRELFISLIEDPNDVICDNKSTALDLLNRVNIQQALWNNVLNLRNGIYYGVGLDNFVIQIDMCKVSKYDSPDFIYGKYDGTVIKRLLSAFSFNPTIINSLPIINTISINPYQQNIIPTTTRIPMINCRLPFNNTDILDISDSINNVQIVLENGVMMNKYINVVYSNVLFIFVDRKSHRPKWNSNILNVRLPLTVTGYETLDDRDINFELQIKISEDIYRLRSVVFSNINSSTSPYVEKNLVIGSGAIIIKPSNIENGEFSNQYHVYDPMHVFSKELTDEVKRPMSVIDENISTENYPSFRELVRKRGILFMYELVKKDKNTDFYGL